MQPIVNQNKYLAVQILVLTSVAVLAFFLWQGDKGFSLWDEGFLWYGVQRVMVGEVPLRDFMAYDPGRYYWSAGLMSLMGDNGIWHLRIALAIFQTAGLFVGLYLIASVKKQALPYLLLCAITLVVWMMPRHKLFDISLSLFSIGVLTFLIQNPTSLRYFLCGLAVGIIAVFGRNHGVYAVAGSLGVMLWLSIRRTDSIGFIKGVLLWAGGIVVGFSPIIFMSVLIPGFASAFLDSIRFLFEVKATNLPVPVPWPWLVNADVMPVADAIRSILIGCFFIAMLVFGTASIVWVCWQKFKAKPVPAALVACAFLALPYAHFAYSRADMGHLAQGIFPLLVGCLVLLATQTATIKWPGAILLCAASVWVAMFFQPGWACRDGQCVPVEIAGHDMVVDAGTASDIKLLRQLAAQYAPNNQTFIAAPFWPGAYALLDRQAPVWEIYPLFPRSATFEQAEIERIKSARPQFAILLDQSLDGRDELRFKNTHPLIYQYILDNFELVPHSTYSIFKAKGN